MCVCVCVCVCVFIIMCMHAAVLYVLPLQILQLNSLCVYWDTDTQLFGDLPSSEWLVS